MDTLPCIFFQMGATDTDTPVAFIHGNLNPAMLTDRSLVLRNLVALGKIRIKVVLACKHIVRRNGAIQSQTRTHGHLHRRLVEYRQRTGEP